MTAVSLTTVTRDGEADRPEALPKWTERVERFGSDGSLIGIVTDPISARRRTRGPAFVLITAGMVHRVGPSRLYVNLARRLSGAGLTAVRFDLSGIGDSQHRSDGLPSDESAVLECGEVMDALRIRCGCETFVLLGLCSGAVTAFRTALRDARVVGAVLLNPQGFDHDPAWNAQVENRREARRYIGNALLDPGRWWRALSGRIDYRRLLDVVTARVADLGGRASAKSPVAAALGASFHALAARGAQILVACSEGDSSTDYMTAIVGREAFHDHATGPLMLRMFARADHSFTLGSTQQQLFDLVVRWASRFES